MKRFLTFLIVLLALGGLGFLYTTQNKTYWNDDDVIGNTAGNLYNGGLFCESGDKIYFSNYKDEGTMYTMNTDGTKVKKFNDDISNYINVAGKYIFYARRNNLRGDGAINVLEYNTTGIYRINKDGSHMKMMYNDPSGILSVAGNYIYYQHYNSKIGLNFYKIKINGKENKELSKEAIKPASIIDGKLYYTGVDADHNIHCLDLATDTTNEIINGNCMQPIATDQYIYYMDMNNNYSLVRTDLDGNNLETMIEDRIFTYNLSNSGRYLFYQTDATGNDGIYKLNIENGEKELIQEGNFKNINITSNFVFFEDTLSGLQYIYSMNGNVEVFEP